MSLKPGTANPYPESSAGEEQLSFMKIQMDPPAVAATLKEAELPGKVGRGPPLELPPFVGDSFLQEQLAYQDAKYPREPGDLVDWQPDDTQTPLWTPHCQEPAERPPPTTEAEVRTSLPGLEQGNAPTQYLCSSSFQLLLEFYRQQNQIQELREELNQKDVSVPPAEASTAAPPGSLID